jgi:large subunit ribosomal protein L6e
MKALWKKKYGATKPDIKKLVLQKTAKKVVEKTKTKKITGAKNGTERVVLIRRGARSYLTQTKGKPQLTKKSKAKTVKTPALRKNITPGTILILLAGRHKGKRVVFLKQLPSGLLLVTGPYAVNGCPLRRINQVYVIATKTKLDISSVNFPETLNDAYFNRQKPDRKNRKKESGEIFAKTKEEYKVSEQRKKDQETVDKQILDLLKKHPEKNLMKGYLRSMFSLKNKQYPHAMVF